jgi:hypothetical protein
MTRFWHNWFLVWCFSIGVFGAVLAGAGFTATDGPVSFVLASLNGPSPVEFNPLLRFATALMGAVTIGWAVTLYGLVGAAVDLGAKGRGIWDAITAGMVAWFVIDGCLSVATGYAANLIPNVVLAAVYLIGLKGSGVLKPASGQ